MTLLDTEYLTADDVILCPQQGVLQSRSEAEILPFIYSSPMDTVTGYELTSSMLENGHYPVVCRFLDEEWEKTFIDYYTDPRVFFAIGSKEQDTKALKKLITERTFSDKVEISINIDVAHGDTVYMNKLYEYYSNQPYIGYIMSGSICTPEAAERAVRAGCTHLRVGIGPGSACTTRLKTGCGMPQLTAVYKIHKHLQKIGRRNNVSIIADGGVRYPGDAVKYLAAGADAIMMGQRFSPCYESAGWYEQDGKTVKRYRGQASAEFQKEMLSQTPDCAEGASTNTFVPQFNCRTVINEFEGGVRSALSYLGLRSISELQPSNITFYKVTQAAQQEGQPHATISKDPMHR